MNPFLNPIFLIKAIKGQIVDANRIKRLNEKQLKNYKDKVFRKVVRYAYTTPVYHKKYRDEGIHPEDIKGIEDIEKLPFISKDDLRNNFPDGIVPDGFDKEKSFKLSTSGSTGKPVTIYRDTYGILSDLFGYIRELREYNISWIKNRITFIADLVPGVVGSVHFNFSHNKNQKPPLLSFKNFQMIDMGEDIEKIMQKLNDFKPEFIGGYPDVLQGLAILKQKGLGEKVNPLCIQSTAAVLSKYARKHIEKTFECEVFDSYSSTEAGPAVFECINHKYHIHEDMVHLEFVDEKMEPVDSGKPGYLVVTRLSCGGTPIVRYTGNDDIMVPSRDECNCGNNSRLVKNIVGRSIDTIILPNGKIILPLSITHIPHTVMQQMKTKLIQQFQIIQRDFDEIDVLIVRNKELKVNESFVRKVFSELEKRFKEKLGGGIKITIKEVDEVERSGTERVVRQVISLVDYKASSLNDVE